MQTSLPLTTIVYCRGLHIHKEYHCLYRPLTSLTTTELRIIVLRRGHLSRQFAVICPRLNCLASLSLNHTSPLSPQTSQKKKKKSTPTRLSHPANHTSCPYRKTWEAHLGARKRSRETSNTQTQKPSKTVPSKCRPDHPQNTTTPPPPARSTGPRPSTSRKATTGRTSLSPMRGGGSRTESHRGSFVSVPTVPPGSPFSHQAVRISR